MNRVRILYFFDRPLGKREKAHREKDKFTVSPKKKGGKYVEAGRITFALLLFPKAP